MPTLLEREWGLVLVAVQALTRVPVSAPFGEGVLRRGARYFPLVGVGVGVVAAGVFEGARMGLAGWAAAVLSLGATVLLTGGMHEDGLADCCDGLFGGRGREAALRIMRDSRVGVFGVLGLGVVLGVKVGVVGGMVHPGWALVAGHAVGRLFAVLVRGCCRMRGWMGRGWRGGWRRRGGWRFWWRGGLGFGGAPVGGAGGGGFGRGWNGGLWVWMVGAGADWGVYGGCVGGGAGFDGGLGVVGGCVARGLIFVARHPRPRVGGRICYGRMDVPLAESAEAGGAALLAAVGGEAVERIVSSPSSRALLVAEAVARETGAPLHRDDRLMEMDFGAWEGVAWGAVPRDEVDAWAADPLRYRPGGAENVEGLLLRVRRAWTGIASSEANTLVVTHAGPIRCLLHVGQGVPILEAIQVGVAFGSVTRFG